MMALVDLITLILEGRTPTTHTLCPLFFRANLTVVIKKDDGIHPTMGCPFRRLASKVACFHVLESILQLLTTRQGGFGIAGGAEAAVRASRVYLSHLTLFDETRYFRL